MFIVSTRIFKIVSLLSTGRTRISLLDTYLDPILETDYD